MIKYIVLLLISFSSFAQLVVDLKIDKGGDTLESHCKGVTVANHQIITALHCVKNEEDMKKIVLEHQGLPYKLHTINYEDKANDLVLIEIQGSFDMDDPLKIHKKSPEILWIELEKSCQKQEELIYKCEASEGDSGTPLFHKTESDWLLRGILTEGDKKKGLIKISPISDEMMNYIYIF